MSPDRREILEQVARGELSPEDADRLLRDAAEDVAASTPPPPPPPRDAIKRVKIRCGFGSVVVSGDDTVSTAEVDGMHSASIEGDTFVIHGEVEREEPGSFEFDRPRRRPRRAFGVGPGFVRIGRATIGAAGIPGSSLRIRMNPALDLDIRLDAGSVSIGGVRGEIRARMSAGPITVDDFSAPLDVTVNAGAIRASGKLTAGESRVKSDAGAVRIELDPSSSVRIVADAALGKVVLPGYEPDGGRRISSRREAMIGDGEATLRVETAMGSINVTTL